jgi:hypothetical protein
MHRKPALTVFLAILAVRITPHTLQAATWNITAGAESSDLGRQPTSWRITPSIWNFGRPLRHTSSASFLGL